jgi:hypothetical protein
VFGDVASGAYLVKFAWTPIVRHTLVKGGASPDDPALTEYWATRRRRIKPPLDGYTLRLLTKQDGRCPLCPARRTGTAPAWFTPPADAGTTPATAAARHCNLSRLRGLLELLAVKAARAVLRGPRRSNAPGLPD